jgi:hypothetical protein
MDRSFSSFGGASTHINSSHFNGDVPVVLYMILSRTPTTRRGSEKWPNGDVRNALSKSRDRPLVSILISHFIRPRPIRYSWAGSYKF